MLRASTEPMHLYEQRDGRLVFLAPDIGLEFRTNHEQFSDAVPANQCEILEAGLVIRAVSKLRFTDDNVQPRAREVCLQAVYSGSIRTIEVPVSKYHPGGKRAPTEAPVFDISVADPSLARPVFQAIGVAAMPYLLSRRYPYFDGVTHGDVAEAVQPGARYPYLDHIQPGSIRYTTPS